MKLTKILVVALCCFTGIASANRRKNRGYSKAVEGQAVVLNKLFPKAGRAEIVSNFGGIINQSYINSLLLHGGFNYYFSEVWGMSIEGIYALNNDKNERLCLENFYNKANNSSGGANCYTEGDKENNANGTTINMGPAYVPITKLQYLFSLSTVWTPIYGKQIFSALPMTGHMDIFFTIGGGVAMTNYYPKKTKTADNRDLRCTTMGDNEAVLPGNCGVTKDQTEHWGEKGRPEPQNNTTLAVNLGIGQKYYFATRLYFDIELRNYTLIGGEEAIHNFFALWGGLGLRF